MFDRSFASAIVNSALATNVALLVPFVNVVPGFVCCGTRLFFIYQIGSALVRFLTPLSGLVSGE